MRRKAEYKIKNIRCIAVIMFLFAIGLLNISWTNIGHFRVISGYYGVDNDNMIISGVSPGVSKEDFLSRLYCDKTLVLSGDIKTNAVVTNGHYSYAIAVTGDIDGDGAVTNSDSSALKSYVANELKLSDAQRIAADLNGDGTVNAADETLLQSCIDGETHVVGCKSPQAETLENFCLLENGSQKVWKAIRTDKKIKFDSSDDAVASVDENGNVISHGAGTAMITAKAGKETASMLVTVVPDKVQISMEESLIITLGETKRLTPFLSHPGTYNITWQSSDPSVAEVSQDGNITSISAGGAVITATLENGQQASANVSVMCKAAEINFERSMYKCKISTVKQLEVVIDPSDSNEPIIWSSSDESIATVEDGAVSGLAYGTVTITATTKYTGLSAQCEVEVCDFKQVAMTFDDGPGMYTMKLLDFLKEKNIHATFFMIGNLIPHYEETVKRMAEDGNELGYHSYDHTWQTSISLSEVTAKFEKTQGILYDLTGRKATVWRSPGGYYNQNVLDTIKLPHIFWTVDTRDWEKQNQNADFVKNSILSQAKDGAIILCHDIYSSTVDGAIEAINIMLDDGYEFLTVTELLSRHGEAPQASVNYRVG